MGRDEHNAHRDDMADGEQAGADLAVFRRPQYGRTAGRDVAVDLPARASGRVLIGRVGEVAGVAALVVRGLVDGGDR